MTPTLSPAGRGSASCLRRCWCLKLIETRTSSRGIQLIVRSSHTTQYPRREFMQPTALWYTAPGRAELRAEQIATPGPSEVCVRALYGAISRGTERLVFGGRVPESEFERMRAPMMAGTFPYPV